MDVSPSNVLCLFGDVAYAVLPLLVLALVTALIGGEFENFLLLKEWSFASVVLLGVTIRRTVQVKTDLQRDTRSYRFDVAVQGPILVLIMSVIVLAFVSLQEHGKFPEGNAPVLALAQLLIFIVTMVLFFAAVIIEDREHETRRRLPKTITRNWLIDAARRDLKNCTSILQFVKYEIDRLGEGNFREPQDPSSANDHERALVGRLKAELAETRIILESIDARVQALARPAA